MSIRALRDRARRSTGEIEGRAPDSLHVELKGGTVNWYTLYLMGRMRQTELIAAAEGRRQAAEARKHARHAHVAGTVLERIARILRFRGAGGRRITESRHNPDSLRA